MWDVGCGMLPLKLARCTVRLSCSSALAEIVSTSKICAPGSIGSLNPNALQEPD